MACKIRQEDKINGIHKEDEIVKVLQYAGDTNGILQDKRSARHFLDTVQEYWLYSGLSLNTTKTEGTWLGKYRHNRSKPLNIRWPDRPLRIVGIYLPSDEEACYKYNFESKINKAKHFTNLWSMRNLTLYGRAQIIRTFHIPQFLFVCSAIATTQKVYSLVNRLTFKFIWKSTSERLKRNVLIKDYGRGGLKIPDFKTLVETALIK